MCVNLFHTQTLKISVKDSLKTLPWMIFAVAWQPRPVLRERKTLF